MKKPLVLLLVATHVVVFATGYLAHRAAGVPDKVAVIPPRPPEPVVNRRPGGVVAAADRDASRPGSDYRKAWNALKGSQVPAAELAALRQRILREWLAKDLRGALIAWSDEEMLNPNDVVNAAKGAIDGREDEVLDWIKAGDFGLDGAPILIALVTRTTANDPALMLKLMPKVPEEFQERAMRQLFASHGNPGADEPEIEKRIAAIADLPDERLRTLAWQAVLLGMANRGDERFTAVLGRDDLPAEARRGGLRSWAEVLAGAQTKDKALEDFRRLAPEDQANIGPILLERARSLSFARPLAVTNALAMLVESGQWELLASGGPETVDHFFKSSMPNPEAVSRWALELPPRQETAGIFRRAVAPRFRGDLSGGAGWAWDLPIGWHRDQALAQLAMTAGSHHQNPGVRDQAIAGISDPVLHAELVEWRQTGELSK